MSKLNFDYIEKMILNEEYKSLDRICIPLYGKIVVNYYKVETKNGGIIKIFKDYTLFSTKITFNLFTPDCEDCIKEISINHKDDNFKRAEALWNIFTKKEDEKNESYF